MSSLLVLVQSRNSVVFSVGANFSVWKFWLCSSRLWRREKLVFEVRIACRGAHNTIGNVGLALDHIVGVGPFGNFFFLLRVNFIHARTRHGVPPPPSTGRLQCVSVFIQANARIDPTTQKLNGVICCWVFGSILAFAWIKTLTQQL